METFLLFLLGVFVVILGTWLWVALTGVAGSDPVRQIEERQAIEDNERLITEFLDAGLPRFSRREIRDKMSSLWKETRGRALASRGFSTLCCLAFFAGLYAWVWAKTALFPNSNDLRLLMGGRALVLHIAQKREED